MDNLEKMMQQILAKMKSYQEKAEASMAKLLEDKMDTKMDSYQKKAEVSMAKLLKDKMDAKMDSYQEKAEASMEKLEEKMEEIMEAFLTNTDAIRGKKKTGPQQQRKRETE
jgi:hypothetical protein